MLQSLHRTWLALAVAGAAVVFVAFLVGRDFVADVYPQCPGSLEARPLYGAGLGKLDPASLDVWTPEAPGAPRTFQLRFDQKTDPRFGYGTAPQYSNVRIVWNDVASDGRPCACGSMPVFLSGESPSDLRLFREHGEGDAFVLKGRFAGNGYDPSSEVRVAFSVGHAATRHLQIERVLTMRHLPALIVVLALGALGVALLRSRRAMSYAQRIHTWTEAELTDEGLLEGEGGATLGMLEQGRVRRIDAGPVLVAPEALASAAGLYRDMPIVPSRAVAEGTHQRWASGTMLRLRDARALAVISTLCTVLALGARVIA